jgi:hypothetical protein
VAKEKRMKQMTKKVNKRNQEELTAYNLIQTACSTWVFEAQAHGHPEGASKMTCYAATYGTLQASKF